MNTNENFDALWSDMKARIAQARGSRQGIYTYEGSPLTQVHGGRVQVGEVSTDDQDLPYTNLSVGRNNWSGLMAVNREDLLNLGAQCLAAAQEMEAKNGRFDPMAHGHLLGDIDAPRNTATR